MSKEEELDVLNQLESVVEDAFTGIKGEWQALQLRLLTEARSMSDGVFEQEKEIKALLCVGSLISSEQFASDDDEAERVGPSVAEYIGIGSGNPMHARMQPAVGVKSSADMHKFLSDKSLVCSLYEVTDYVSLFMHAKFAKSELIAMSSPDGIAVLLDHKDKEPYSFYLMSNDEKEENVQKHMMALSEKQRNLVMQMMEAQVVAPYMKKTQPKIWNLMIEAIREHNPNGFLNPTEGDE